MIFLIFYNLTQPKKESVRKVSNKVSIIKINQNNKIYNKYDNNYNKFINKVDLCPLTSYKQCTNNYNEYNKLTCVHHQLIIVA